MKKPYIKFLPLGAFAKPWRPVDLFAAYGFPRGLLPGGGVIAIGELGGGWLQSDLDEFFEANGLPGPAVTDVSVDGSNNNGDPTDPASGEVALDIQIAAAAYAYLTGKPADVRMYWARNGQGSIPNATEKAASDGCDVFSWSWGSDEARTGDAECQQMEAVCAAATAAGTTICAAAGDNDASDGGPTPANVDSPASCPHVLACGGTRKPQAGRERVWNHNPGRANGEGTGGGVSTVFALPSWQTGVPSWVKGRMVPDVAANADPVTGWEIVLGGKTIAVGGTSAVAPLYAGFIAACGPKRGFVNPIFWGNQSAFHVQIAGNNGPGPHDAQPPYPGPCTGLGSLLAVQLAQVLTKA